jgi:hypothetical protein
LIVQFFSNIKIVLKFESRRNSGLTLDNQYARE